VKIIGIDTGLRATGISILKEEKVLYWKVIRTDGDDIGKRLLKIYREIKSIIKEWNPEIAAFEEIIFHKSFRSLVTLGAVRGIVLLALSEEGVRIKEYSPTLIKKTLTGNGRASKKQVAFIVRKILNLHESLPSHITDSIACALVTFYKERKCFTL